MACSKFEESGLLYSSQELDSKNAKEFEEHLELCQECEQELKSYTQDRVRLFSLDVLGESPSPAIDQEIKRVCGSTRKQITNVGVLPFIFKKTLFSVSFFVLGFVVVGYFVMNADNANKRKALQAASASYQDSINTMASALNQEYADIASDSASNDSLRDSVMPFSKNRGNLGVNGVFPVVDLNEK